MGTDLLESGEGISTSWWKNTSNKPLMVAFIKRMNDCLHSLVEPRIKRQQNTVIRAYQELEAQNLVYSVPKSGYRVKIALPTSRSIPDPTRVDLLDL